jgi:hypothetical protein
MNRGIVLRLIAALLGVTLAQAYFIPLNGLRSIATAHPMMVLVGTADVLWWCLGIGAVVGLFALKPASRWLLLGCFLLGIVGSWIAWIPYVGALAGYFDTAAGRFLALQLPNLLVLGLVFWLFGRAVSRE